MEANALQPDSQPVTTTELAQAQQGQFSRRRALGLTVGAVLILALMAIFGWKLFEGAQTQVDSGVAPDFTLSLFDGGQLTLAELQGQVVVVNFWASWCIPCRDEAPILEQAWQRYRDRGVVFVGVAYLDTDKESEAFLEEFKVTYPNGPDLGTKIAPTYRLAGVPETFFINKTGQVADLEIGPLTETRLVSAIEKLLKE
jgi:cytochrome c biogenesis protein CcmG/thiol:disulfide interchange protein DsbE